MELSYFFKDIRTIGPIVNYIAPLLIKYKSINIWHTRCGHGPKPYSLAILLRECLGHCAFKRVKIDATDIDSDNRVGKLIRDGVYLKHELSAIPPEIRKKYFVLTDYRGHYRILDTIKLHVTFAKHNLLSLSSPGQSKYNLIICRNVLPHFEEEQQLKIINMYHKNLIPGGFLLIGDTQHIHQGADNLFERTFSHYQLLTRVPVDTPNVDMSLNPSSTVK